MFIREINKTEYALLENFLYHAVFVPPGEEPPPRDVIKEPTISLYIDGFGEKRGDCGVVAEIEDINPSPYSLRKKIVGAAWTRIIPAYGHIDDDTPELSTSVLPAYRGRGVGMALMTRLFELLRERGFTQTSLAVQQKNDAVRFYQRLGYETIRENDEEYIMVKDLTVRKA